MQLNRKLHFKDQLLSSSEPRRCFQSEKWETWKENGRKVRSNRRKLPNFLLIDAVIVLEHGHRFLDPLLARGGGLYALPLNVVAREHLEQMGEGDF